MNSRASAMLPVDELRGQITELEAALLEVLHKPKKKAVHRVRTATRRIEAQLELIAGLADAKPELRRLGDRRDAERRTRKALKRLRKAAGKVRDLDVQRDLVLEAAGGSAAGRLDADAGDLRDWLKRQRKREAEKFHADLEARRDRLAPRLEAVLALFAPVAEMRVTEAQLVRATGLWFSRCAAEVPPETSADDRLHALRKSAKLARYMLESGGGSMRRAKKLAGDFEDLQNCGGQWHDLLTLTQLARRHLSRKSELVRRLARQEERRREAFRAQAAGFAPIGGS